MKKNNRTHYKVLKCEFSQKNDLVKILSLGKMPAVNNYIKWSKKGQKFLLLFKFVPIR